MRRILLGTVAAAVLGGCGISSASVDDLRCDGTSCQDTADPFLLKLAASYEDPDGVMESGTLVVTINGSEAARYQLGTLLDPKRPPAGTIKFPLALHFKTISDGQQFTIGVKAETSDGTTGEAKRDFVLHL